MLLNAYSQKKVLGFKVNIGGFSAKPMIGSRVILPSLIVIHVALIQSNVIRTIIDKCEIGMRIKSMLRSN